MEQKFLDLIGLQIYHDENMATMDEKDIAILKLAKEHAEKYANDLVESLSVESDVQKMIDELANGQVKDNTEAIEKLNGDTNVEGSVDNKIDKAKNELSVGIQDAREVGNEALTISNKNAKDISDLDKYVYEFYEEYFRDSVRLDDLSNDIEMLDTKKMNLPVDEEGNISNGENGQSLVSNGDGSFSWKTVASEESPEFTGSVSLGREENSVIGEDSVALGSNVVADSIGSFAMGDGAKAISPGAHAEGKDTLAGCKGYYYKYIDLDRKKIYLASEQPTIENPPMIVTEERQPVSSYAPNWSVGAGIALYNQATLWGEIFVESISEGVITYSGDFSLTKIEMPEIMNYDTFAVYAPEHPYEGEWGVTYGGHAEGYLTYASGNYSHAEGAGSMGIGHYSHAEGKYSQAIGGIAHAEGDNTQAKGTSSHTEGRRTIAAGSQAHAEGNLSQALKNYSHAEGEQTVADGISSHTEGKGSKTTNNYSHAEGYYTEASGIYAHAEGGNTVASGGGAHSEGVKTQAIAAGAHSEGENSIASGANSHAEGFKSQATNEASHAEGRETIASGNYSHAEGRATTASGGYAHAEGHGSVASGSRSHAEGYYTTAKGSYTHAEGYQTIAKGNMSHVEGKYNIEDTANRYAHIVGNGTAEDARSNAHTLDWNGNAWYAGKVEGTNIGNVNSLKTKNKYNLVDAINEVLESVNDSDYDDTELRTAVEDHEEKISALESQVAEVSEVAEEALERVGSVEGEIDNLGEVLNFMSSKINTLEEEVKTASEIADDLEEKRDSGYFDGEPGKDGAKGDKGDKGEPGEAGIGISSTSINNKGELVVVYTTGNSANLGVVVGKDGANGEQGIQGENGQDGYTPQKGIDYWNANDIAEIHLYIDTQLGVIENGTY